MTTTDPLATILERWMREDAPPAVPDRLLDAVRLGAARTPQRSGSPWRFIGVGLAAAAVVAIAVATQLPDRGVGEDPSPTPAASSGEATSSAAPSAAPTTVPIAAGPAPAGDPLLRFEQGCDVTPPIIVPTFTVLEDGRAIWFRTTDEFGNGEHVIRQLSPDGVQTIRQRVDQTGLFGADAFYPLEVRPGAEPPGHGLCAYTFTWSDGEGEPVVVGSIGWLGAEEESAYYEPAPEREALHALAADLGDPESWLDESAWSSAEAVPYEPTDYVVLVTDSIPQLADPAAPDIDALTWPFAAGPDAFGELREGTTPPQRCGIAAPEAVDTFADELAAAGLEQFVGALNGARITLPWAARGAAVEVWIFLRMPDDWPRCQVEAP